MNAPVSRLAIVGAAVVGACFPFAWVVITMLFFRGPQDAWWIRLFSEWIPDVLCPTWNLGWQGSEFWLMATPFVNALMYAVIAYAYLKAKSLRRGKVEQMAKPPV